MICHSINSISSIYILISLININFVYLFFNNMNLFYKKYFHKYIKQYLLYLQLYQQLIYIEIQN